MIPQKCMKRKEALQKEQHTYTGWWFGTCCFPYIGNVIIPTDEVIFFRGVGQPPTTTNQRSCSKSIGFPLKA